MLVTLTLGNEKWYNWDFQKQFWTLALLTIDYIHPLQINELFPEKKSSHLEDCCFIALYRVGPKLDLCQRTQ